MSQFVRHLSVANVLVGLSAASKKRVFEQVGLLFENNHGLNRAAVFDSLFAREKLGSTGLGQGVAIPHGRIKGLKEILTAVIRLAEPVAFDAPDGHPVSLLAVLLVPEQASQTHLDCLSELAQMLSDKAFRERLMTAPDAAALYATLQDWEQIRPAA